MAYYPQFPPAAMPIYAYPMPAFSNQEFFAMYPQSQGGMDGSTVYYENNNNYPKNNKPGYANRKESTDSGISDFSSISSRKTSAISTSSIGSNLNEDKILEDVKEELPPMEDPNDELCESIVQQVEFYFSDANITKDKFLLKHVKRNKEGFVSLKLISSFKRVKHLTKDWRQVAVAIERKSKKLEVNDLKTKVRRLDDLPEYDETTPSRTVVALNLPIERPTIEAVAELFSACGEIVLVRILRPGNPIPADVKPFANKHPEMTDKVCALVEYERTEFAHRAVKDLNKEGPAEDGGMKVMELTAPPPKKTKPSADEKKKASFGSASSSGLRQPLQLTPQRRFSHAGFGMHQSNAGSGQQDNIVIPKRKISLFHNMKFNGTILEEQAAAHAAAAAAAEQQKKEFGLNPNAPSFNMQQYAAHSHPRGRRSVQYMPMEAPMMMMQPVLVNPPRRLSAVAGGHAELAVSGLALPPNVLRLPRGPDKGKGFQRWCKSRMTHPAESTTTATTPAARENQKQNPPTPQRKSRAIPIVAPPAADDSKVGGADVQDLVRGAAALSVSSDEATPAPVAAVASAPPAPVIAAPAPAAVPAAVVAAANNNLIVNLESSDSDEGHFSDHDLEDNERSR